MRRRAIVPRCFTCKLLGWFASLIVWAGATACSDGVPTTPSEPGSEGQFARAKGPLRVTPPQLTFTALAANATLSAASTNAGAITVEVSTPACVTVTPRRVTRTPATILRLPAKGRVAVGADADLAVLDDAGGVTDVMARGAWHVVDGVPVVKDPFSG